VHDSVCYSRPGTVHIIFCSVYVLVELVVNERKMGSIIHARHSNPFISLQFIEYIVTGDSVYYSGSLPYRRSCLYSEQKILIVCVLPGCIYQSILVLRMLVKPLKVNVRVGIWTFFVENNTGSAQQRLKQKADNPWLISKFLTFLLPAGYLININEIVGHVTLWCHLFFWNKMAG
jgi:hypothetical protein